MHSWSGGEADCFADEEDSKGLLVLADLRIASKSLAVCEPAANHPIPWHSLCRICIGYECMVGWGHNVSLGKGGCKNNHHHGVRMCLDPHCHGEWKCSSYDGRLVLCHCNNCLNNQSFLEVSIVMTLEKVLEVFKGFIIKVLLTVAHIILDVLFWK